MSFDNILQDFQKYITLLENFNTNPFAYQAVRGAVEVVNTVQMAVA